MINFEKNWAFCSSNGRIANTNFNPWDFVFKCKTNRIHTNKPNWKTLWFKALSFLGVAGTLGYKYKQRIEKLEKESKANEEFLRKLIGVQEDEKMKIAHDLHHTVAHEVLMFKQKAMLALKHKDDKERMEKTLEEISELSSATISEVRNIAYNLHPHQLAKLGFTKTIKSIVNEISWSTNINFVFESHNVDELLSKEIEINLFRLIQETITNIIKHSQVTKVILKVSKSDEHILITLIDNGTGNLSGKEFTELESELGISITERLKIMKGVVCIDSKINRGTSLTYKIPINNNNG
ncbi:MAG: sensor histidine kinase [bacterium]